MEFTGILFSLFFAVVLTAIFGLAFRNTGPWNGFWIFFILLFFAAFGAGEWAAPRGPSAWGYYWAPGLLAAILLALALAAASPTRNAPRRSGRPGDDRGQEDADEATVATVVIGTFFWLLVLGLIAIAVAGALYQPVPALE